MKPHRTVQTELTIDPLGDALADCYGFLLHRLAASQPIPHGILSNQQKAPLSGPRVLLTADMDVDHLQSMSQALS